MRAKDIPAPTLRWVIFASFVLLAFVLGLFWPWTRETDIWWHLKTGEWIVANDAVPSVDLFGQLTQGQPWIAYSWLAEWLFYRVDESFPFLGLRILQSAVLVVTMGVLLLHSWMRSGNFRLALLFCLFYLLAPTTPWTARPQIFSFCFMALTMFLLYLGERRDARFLWLLPPLMMLWANLHVYFLAGLALVLLNMAVPWVRWFLAGRIRAASPGYPAASLILAALVLMAPLLNPYGLDLYQEAFRLAIHGSSSWAAEVVTELASPDFHGLLGKVFLAWVVLGLLAFVFSPRRPSWLVVLVFLGLLYQGLQHRRDIPYFVIVMLPFLVEQFAAFQGRAFQKLFPHQAVTCVVERIGSFRACLHWGIIIGMMAVAVFSSSRIEFADSQPGRDHGDKLNGVMGYMLNEGTPPPLYSPIDWGGYIIYKAWPSYRPYIDGRTQLYKTPLWESYETIKDGKPGWEQELAQSGACTVIWPRNQPLASLLLLRPDWTLSYQDESAVLFVRAECHSSMPNEK